MGDGEICTGERGDNPDINGAYFTNGKKPNTCVEVDCQGHDDCGEKERCSSYQCVPVECTTEDHCGEQELCKDAVCTTVECRDHTHCADFFLDPATPYKCQQQTCVAVKCTSATDCGQGRLCDKATNESAWDTPVAKKLLVAKMVPAVAKPKRTLMVPTLVTNESRLNAEPTITVQKQKNFVTTKPTNVTKLTAHHTPTVIKRMVTKNVLPTTVKRLVASPMHIAVPWLSAKPINASMFNVRPTVIVHLDQFVEIKNVSQ